MRHGCIVYEVGVAEGRQRCVSWAWWRGAQARWWAQVAGRLRACWRSLWLGLECVDGSLAGAVCGSCGWLRGLGRTAGDAEAWLAAVAASGFGAGGAAVACLACLLGVLAGRPLCVCVAGRPLRRGHDVLGRPWWRLWLVSMFCCCLL